MVTASSTSFELDTKTRPPSKQEADMLKCCSAEVLTG